MTGGQIAKSAIEILLVAIVLVALFNERSIADFEQTIFQKIKQKLKIRRIK